MPGILGNDVNAKPKQVSEKKADFSDIFMQDAALKQQHISNIKKAAEKERPQEDQIKNLNSALAGENEAAKQVEKELEELAKFSKEDLELAEQLLFDGVAKKLYKLSEKYSATLFSTNASEISVINELMYEFTKKYESADGRLDVSQKTMDHMHQLYLLAISFKGYNDKDISNERIRTLELLKAGFKKLAEFEISGDLDNYKKVCEEIKKIIRARAAEIKKLPAAVIDALSNKRYEFERMMYDIVTRGDVLPKS